VLQVLAKYKQRSDMEREIIKLAKDLEQVTPIDLKSPYTVFVDSGDY
jgi:hypothetical protein